MEGRRCANRACEPPERRPRRSTPATSLDHYASPLGQQLPCDPTLGALRPCSRPHIAVVDLKGVKPLVGAQLISVDALMEASRVGWSCRHLRDPWLRTTGPGARTDEAHGSLALTTTVLDLPGSEPSASSDRG